VTPTETIAVPVWSSASAGRAGSLRARAAWWERVVLEPVDISFLVTFRVALGLLLAISMERFLAYGWVDSLLLEPSFRFKYFGFEWVEPLARGPMLLLFRVLVGLGLAVAAGFCFRVSAVLLALGLSYIQLIDVSTYLNHYYLAALLAWLLAFSPAHRAGSVDAWLRRVWARARGHERPAAVSHVPRAFLWLLRLQIGLVYFCAGLAKLQSDWLIHAQPLRIWLGASTDLPLLGRMLTWPGAPLVVSWVGFLFDATIVFWLSWSRSRPYAYLVVLVFHTLTRLLFDIGMFPWIMSACALIFFPPGTARHLLGRRSAPRPADISKLTSHAVRAALALGLIYASVQVVMPFRHLAYGGNVLWHEQGMRFSWRVMVRAKGGAVSFLVKLPDREQPIVVDPKQYLTAFQENEMAGQPDLILQMAHHIGRMYEARGPGPAEVYATTHISLNGRRPASLVDPGVDLMKVRDGLRPASWILPAPTADPPHIVPVL
jgi:vitamin K-dependent gamma-carboxylase